MFLSPGLGLPPMPFAVGKVIDPQPVVVRGQGNGASERLSDERLLFC